MMRPLFLFVCCCIVAVLVFATQASALFPGCDVIKTKNGKQKFVCGSNVEQKKLLRQKKQTLRKGEHFETHDDGKVCYVKSTKNRCFGAVGPGCSGVIVSIFDTNRKVIPGTRDFTLKVSVGSILHDNCCLMMSRKGITGQMCNMNDLLGTEGPCSKEWQKAVTNTLEGAMWDHKFERYLRGEYDEVGCEVPSRKASLYTYGKKDKEIYEGMETEITRRMCAPVATKLDIEDEQFCCSQQFSSKSSQHGICA